MCVHICVCVHACVCLCVCLTRKRVWCPDKQLDYRCWDFCVWTFQWRGLTLGTTGGHQWRRWGPAGNTLVWRCSTTWSMLWAVVTTPQSSAVPNGTTHKPTPGNRWLLWHQGEVGSVYLECLVLVSPSPLHTPLPISFCLSLSFFVDTCLQDG